MKVRIIFAIIIVILLLLIVVFLTAENGLAPTANEAIEPPVAAEEKQDSPREKILNATYFFAQEAITLHDGLYVSNAPLGSAGYKLVNIFGEPDFFDLDNDGDNDAVLLLTQQTSGTGIFYYVAAAINQDNNYQGTGVILLGDRIAPQTLEFKDGVIMVNYADRGPEEPMTTPPSFGQTKYLKLESGQLQEVNSKNDLIIVDFPQLNTKITSPLTFSGQARGTWFFEASFPVVLVNWDGLIIAQGIAQATEDWMTEDFVPFSGTLEFTVPDYGDNGAIIFQKDNPSGLPQFDDALEIPILFK